MIDYSTVCICICRLAEVGGVQKHVNVSEIAKQTTIPVATLWKQVNDHVHGTGHRSGGPWQLKVLSKCKYTFSLDFIFYLNRPIFNQKIKITVDYM